MALSDSQVEKLIKEVSSEIDRGGQKTWSGYSATTTAPSYGNAPVAGGNEGVFENINDAIDAAARAQKELMKFTMDQREQFVSAMRQSARNNAEKLAIMAHNETGFGRVEDKIAKNLLAANKTPGTEDLHAQAFTGDNGMTLVEMAPFGVIGAITPSTNPTATIINNGIGFVAAGNAGVFNPHPAAKRATQETIRILNRAIVAAGGPANLLTAPLEPTMETSGVIASHPAIRLMVVTGGEGVVKFAMKSGKRCLAAGPGNPPVVVDDTANIPKAAADIVKGAGFDNCILCIAEKEILAFDSITDQLIDCMVKEGCYLAKGDEIDKLMAKTIEKNKEGKYVPNKKLVGKNASVILGECGIPVTKDYKVVICEVPFEHPFVHCEMLMPVVPISRVHTIDEAVEKAVIAEAGCHHTAMMHSENVTNLTKMAKAIDTTIFVKNAPSYAGLGFGGEGYATLTIATPTGEGLSSAKNFTRSRRCTIVGSFHIV